MWRVRACLLTLILAGITQWSFTQRGYTASDIETGGQQYAANCLRCHGPEGDNVATADVGHGKFRRASTDAELVRLIRNGIPNSTMAAMNNISEQNAQTIVAYLRSMASTAAAVAALPGGNVDRGKSLFEGKGTCTNCHRVGANGSRVGPDLTIIGALRRTVELHRSLLEPDAEIAPTNRTLKISTRDGNTISGRLLNQDSFTIQLLDAKDEKLKSFSRSDVREIEFLTKSPMPSYKDKLSNQELADLISYLASLKGQANP
jgi:putative heme-binding domain-containing protein